MNTGYRKPSSPQTLRQQRRMARRMGMAALAMLRSLPLDVVASLGRFTKHCAALALLAAAMISRTPSPVRAEFGEISADGDAFTVSEGEDDRQRPAIAMDADGNFVVVWESDGQDGSDEGIFARRYDADGEPLGEEFLVNTETDDGQRDPDVAMDADGNFVIVWESDDGSGEGIFAQRYDANGDAQGAEFQVNTETYADQVDPEVAMDADGDFVVVWQGVYYYASATFAAVLAQRYDASGAAQGAEFKVGPPSYGGGNPDVAMNADGDFAVVWKANGEIFMQRYDANGDEQGATTQVNTETVGDPNDARIAMDADGNFVVVWSRDDGSGYDSVFAQRFDASGTPQGGEFEVPNIDNLYANNPAVAMDSDGDFVVAWAAYGYPDGSSDYYHIAARRYNANGEAVADATLIKSIPYDDYVSLDRPAVAIDPDGANHMIVWEEYDYYDYGAEYKIVAQRFVSPIAEEEEEVPDVDTETLGQSLSIGLNGGSGGGLSSKNFVNSKGLKASINVRNTKLVVIRLGAIIIKVPALFGNIKLTNSSIIESSSKLSLSSATAGRATQHSHAAASQVSAAQSVESDGDTLYIYNVDLAPGETYNFEFDADAMDGAPQTATVAITVKSGGDKFTQHIKLSQGADEDSGDSGCALDAGSSRGRFALPFAGALFALLGGWYARRRRRA